MITELTTVDLSLTTAGGNLHLAKVDVKRGATKGQRTLPVLGNTRWGKGHVVAFGDSDCLDSDNRAEKCFG